MATFVILARDGLHRAGLAGFITILAGSAGIQFAVTVAAGALEMVARQAAAAAESEAAARERSLIARQVHGARHARWLALQATAAPLLRALAADAADPGDETVRRSCAVEAARLRRMIAETDDPLIPLVHELHAAADIAERRGVAGLESASSLPADVVILDPELGGRLITGEISRLTGTGRRIVAFSGHSDPAIVMAVLDAGAHAYIAKDEGRDHLVEAVLAAAGDRPYVTRSQAKAILADTRPSGPALSAQERQALLLWFQGMSKASVGRRMSITENTVRQYINRARMKYAATGRPAPSKDALLARAIEDQIITPGEVTMYTSRARQ